jgi:hypothetical protein
MKIIEHLEDGSGAHGSAPQDKLFVFSLLFEEE